MRIGGARRGLSRARHRLRGRRTGFRADRADDGLCGRRHIGRHFNPARSLGVALFATTDALGQLWLFWVAPLLGALIGGVIWRFVLSPGESPANIGQPMD
jgi:hypothetical protein